MFIRNARDKKVKECIFLTGVPGGGKTFFIQSLYISGLIPEDIMIYVTGKYKGKVDEHVIPDNVKLLGFVPDDRFWALLSSVDFILDLTLREGCLVCGAYEGVALGKPLILSDTKALRAYFSQGCLYVAPSGAAIASGIMNAISQRDALIVDIHALKDTLQKSWSLRLQAFQDTLSSL